MTLTLQIITIFIAAICTASTRFLPFIIFRSKNTPAYISYLGDVLPASIFGLLMVYCFKDYITLSNINWIPAVLSVIVIIVAHIAKKNTLLSIAIGTLFYMILVQFVFVG